VADRRTPVKVKGPITPAGLGPRPRLAQRDGPVPSEITEEEVVEEEWETDEPEGEKRPWRSLVCMGAAFVGIGVSVYVTILHYAHVKPVCSDSGAINCEKVLTSPQSVFLGIPVPVYGLVFFVGMFALCVPKLWRTQSWWIPWLRLVGSAVGILFALRLIYEELFVIRNLCLWCTGAHVLSFIMFVVIVTGWEDANRDVIPRGAT
jgi:uncharacterized membrane protein